MSGSNRTNSNQTEPSEEQLIALLAALNGGTDQDSGTLRAADLAEFCNPETYAKLQELRWVLTLIDRAGDATAPPGSEGLRDPGATESIGTNYPERIGHFRIIRELGRGGCGLVFLAKDEALGRQVALKVPRPEALVSRELRRRFLSEAKAAALVDHPNIVPIYEVSADNPVCYIASAFCEGPSLGTWLQQREEPIDPNLVARWISSLADAAQHAHSRGILHRDIKPGNVLLEPRQIPSANAAATESIGSIHSEWTPKLTDFGLAKLQNSAPDMTQNGVLMGTPAYMAPEQAEGRLDAIGPATDVYALGAILYEMLTGKPPCHSGNDPETLRKFVSQEPVPPRRLVPEIPPDLEAICLKCLEKQPRARYASARALGDDLDRFLQGYPTYARPIRWWQRSLRWIQRKPAAAALIVVSILAITTIGIGGWWSSDRNKRALETSRRHLYVSDLRLANQAWQSRDTPQMIHLLQRHIPQTGQNDFRSFPWYYLWRLCHGELQVLENHQDDVYAIDFSPDDTILASAGCDGSVWLWDVATGKPIGAPIRHPDEVNHVRFAPTGTLLASTCDDGSIRLWSYPEKELLHSFVAHSGAAYVIDFAPTGDVFATCGDDYVVKIWSMRTGELVRALEGHTDSVQVVCFSQDGTLLATGSNDHTTRLWEWPSGKKLAALDLSTGHRVCAVAFSPDASILATAGARATEIQLWSVPDGHLLETLEASGVRVRNLSWSPSGDQLVATGDGVTQIWDLNQGHILRSRRGPVGHVWMSQFTSNGRLLATAGRDGTVRLWDSITDLECRYLPTNEPIYEYCFSPEGNMMAIVNTDGTVQVILVATDEVLAAFETGSIGPVTNVAFSPDSNYLAMIKNNATILVGNVLTGKVATLSQGEKTSYSDLAYSTDGRQIACGDKEGLLTIFSTVERRQIIQLENLHNPILDLTYSPNGRQLAVAAGTSVVLMDANNWNRVAKLPHTRLVRCIHYSPHGQKLFAAGDDKKVTLWDLSTQQPAMTYVGHQDRILSISLSAEQKTLATIAGDRTLRLWDVHTGQELIMFPIMESNRPLVAFSTRERILSTNAWNSAERQGIVLLEATSMYSNVFPEKKAAITSARD